MNTAAEIVKHALMISSFVFVMMLLIEYLNVLSRGDWERKIRGRRWAQYLLSSFLGSTPGCLGAFAVVSLYIRRVVTLGALVAVMIATSGDEAFVMLAMFPGKAMLIFALLFVLGIGSGILVDLIRGHADISQEVNPHAALEFHPDEPNCLCLAHDELLRQWRHCSAHRGILTFFLMIFLLGIISGEVGPPVWNWIRGTLVLTASIGLFIVSTVPDHFLEEHLWNHIAKKHIGKIFLWTLGALAVMHILTDFLHLEGVIRENRFMLLVTACLLGIIPESGPHLIFVTLYAQGLIPLSVLLASSIVQDGHGMLPVLAHSRRTFIVVKTINLAIGFPVGLVGYFLGW